MELPLIVLLEISTAAVLEMAPPAPPAELPLIWTVYDGQAAILNRDSATSTGSRVTADCAVDDRDIPRGLKCPTADTATIVVSRVTAQRAIEDRQKRVILDAWSRVITDNAVRDCHRTVPKTELLGPKGTLLKSPPPAFPLTTQLLTVVSAK